MDELSDYLRSRNVPDDTIERMEQDKIDASVLLLMTDDQLKDYLPSYGHRLSLLAFCRRKEKDPSGRKTNLLERLKSKLTRDRSRHSDSAQTKAPKNAQKNERKIEMGWIHFREDMDTFQQVRTKTGGGTRKITVSKDFKKEELTERALKLFFPDGRNAKGSVEDFEIDLTDFQKIALDENTTVGELYEDTRLPMLRFYLRTKKTETLPKNAEGTLAPTPSTNTLLTEAHGDNSDVIFVGTESILLNASSIVSFEYSGSSMTDLSTMEKHDEIPSGGTLEDSNIITFFGGNISETDNLDEGLDDTLPFFQPPLQVPDHPLPQALLQEPIAQNAREKRTIVLHRGQILRELISHFCDEGLASAEVQIQLVHPDGKLEMAVDEGGVVRDCLSEFWKDFYEQCTMGTGFKVPFLRHDFGRQQWESVGRIITFGWQTQKYFPVKLAPVIVEQAAFGYIKSDLIQNFLAYVTESERTILKSCRSDFEKVDQEELMEVMDIQSCRRMPTADNFEQILEELAHKTLIQEPAYVIEQWANILAPISKQLEAITTEYENLQPTSRKVMKSIAYPSIINDQEKDIGRYLSTYLRESDTQHLSLFLRFCTGSDLFLGKTITVSFTQMEGFQRRPIAHTCGCYLELSIHYDNYPDFRYEMNQVLESNMWAMDIV